MKKSGMINLRYLLSAILIIALTGCGANHNLAGVQADGSIASKLVWSDGKSTGKKVGLPAPTGVTFSTMALLVTGSDANGKAIPIVRGTSAGNSSSVAIGGIYPGKVTLAVKAFGKDNATQQDVVYFGYAIGVDVASGATTNLDTLPVPKTIVMTPSQEKLQDTACYQCHETALDRVGQSVVAQFKQSGHYTNSGSSVSDKFVGVVGTGCAGCHGPQHNESNPAASGRCSDCHGAVLQPSHKGNSALIVATNCTNCHQPHNTKTFVAGRCVACHSVAQQANSANNNFVNDNNGVRAITTEFAKWSHHVTGVALNDAHCTACHLEGTVVDGVVVVDTTKHMADTKTHLRNADDDSDFAWDPSLPNHSGMDNFCLSCHDANGATSPVSVKVQSYINDNGLVATGKTASAQNPFGDTISNQYDKMARPAVVDAKGQFAAGNNSHHAVLGKRYTGRTRGNGTTARTTVFANASSALLPGARSTIFDAGRFEPTYTTLADAAGETDAIGTLNGRNGGTKLGDDSTLHCGDCHTVGQFKAADVNVAPFNKAVIGAHGSNNEYLLRNYAGTDVRHIGQQLTTAAAYISTGNYLVCFNCHIISKYGNGQGHDGERGGSEQCDGPYNTRSEPIPGLLNKISSLTPAPATEYTGVGEDRLKSVITQIGGTTAGAWSAQTTGHGGNLGNIYGIQCANCHNSGVDNGFGGIHGSKSQTYTDALGNTTKHERFLPGLGNVMFVPGTVAGYVGGTVATYKNYSGYAFQKYSATSGSNRTIKGYLPASFAQLPVRVGYSPKAGSFTYTTGGVTKDTNWEQKTAGLDNGATSSSQGTSGCYTLSVKGTVKVSALAAAGYPADDIRLAPSDGMKAVDGNEVLDTWGGCEDHGSVAGRSSEPFTRGIIRPVTY